MSSFKISIIIPAFNEENNIRRILECACKQTYKEFEVIVVDDGSKDRTSEIAKTYAKQYSNFIYVHKENSGVSDTRNLGLKFVTGDYVCFWDADDWVGPDFLSNFIKSIGLTSNPQKTVLVAGCTIDYYIKQKKINTEEIHLNTSLFSRKEIIDSFVVKHEDYRLELWNKLFPIEIIKNKKFKSQFMLGEDFEFFTQCLSDIEYLLTVNDNSYHYRIDTSQMKHYTGFKKEIERERIIRKNLINAGVKDKDVNIFYFRRLLITAYTAISFITYDDKHEVKFILNELKKSRIKLYKPYGNYKKAQYIMLFLVRSNSPFITQNFFEIKNKINSKKKN
ncbi:glycosyltransferase family 2 protein [Lactobacillus crispatus]|uniref:Glycosyltransferases involved in cell wall biogenesis n=1 Tax=Lactobacillus crispatus TaxID=47770 RepID=A0AAW4DPX7_9LACO|nr:glycosyltransferase family 2 protein [Lactobacillus crispatus]MBI1708740.1 glycosyltransferases involved in cell wall biogenesis [Lactobacillus crispatus]MBW0436953.1 glycosyltransferase family 2 protein [Lactobacillus crispatus]MBW0444086.1 glycosyltransferase family 2 protein [Lactobacillus crispatus]MBW0455603.1 glycosyltransferase family 2 protein [Lactobacillus crispatus]